MVAVNPSSTAATASLPPALIPIAVGMFLLGGIGQNIGLALFSIAILIVGATLLWRPGESPILLFIFGHQWMQSSLSIFHSNWLGIDVDSYTLFGGDQERALILTLIAVLCLSIGMRLGAGRQIWKIGVSARNTALSQPIQRWFQLYVQASVVAFAASWFGWVIPGLSQIFFALSGFKWAFFFMLAYASFLRQGSTSIFFIIAFGVELGLGVGGFFSDFRSVFYVTLFAIIMSGVRFSPRTIIAISLLGTMVVLFGVVWTAVKIDYRQFVNQGQDTQAVTVDYATRMSKLVELIQNIDSSALNKATDAMVRRLSYVEIFGVVLNVVPSATPHANGEIFADAVLRPFMPRLLFPEKTIIDDSERTNRYAAGIAGTYEATSISLGYIAEAYIDLGTYGMMVLVFLVGYFYGRIYLFFTDLAQSRGLLGSVIASAILFGAALLESSITKTFGGMIAAVLVGYIVIVYVVPMACPWVQAEDRT